MRNTSKVLTSKELPWISNYSSMINLPSLLLPHWLKRILLSFHFFIKKIRKKNNLFWAYFCANITFPNEKKRLLLKIDNQELISADIPQTHFLSQMKSYFSFTEIISNSSSYSCSAPFKVITMYMTTLPTLKIRLYRSPYCHSKAISL